MRSKGFTYFNKALKHNVPMGGGGGGGGGVQVFTRGPYYTPGRGKIVPRNYTPGRGKIVPRK